MPSGSDGPLPSVEAAPQEWASALLAMGHEPQPPADHEGQLEQLLPFCRRFGITRLADITGLDRIGLPIVQAIRPTALSEVTALGRGRSLAQAAIGAIMESCERFFAEAVSPARIIHATADELALATGLFEGLMREDGADGWRSRRLPWIMGIDLPSGEATPVPLELVHTRYTHPPPAGDGVFTRSTTGLACHFSASQALLHGLFECIERDAMARAFRTHGFFELHRIVPPRSAGLTELLKIADKAGIAAAFWQAPSPTGLPVIWCQTLETGPERPLLALPTEGYSARPHLEGACEDALREALVTRAAAISGARDDQTAPHYGDSRFDEALAQARELILHGRATAPAPTVSPTSLAELLALVAASQLGPVLAVPVGIDDEAGITCIRTALAGARAFCVVR